jgi:hypothetical protein
MNMKIAGVAVVLVARAAGAMDGVAKMIAGEPMTMKEFHRNAMARARG